MFEDKMKKKGRRGKGNEKKTKENKQREF